MICRRCRVPMERYDNQFYWRGTYAPGWVCPKCNALYPIKGEEIEPLKEPKNGMG